MALDLRRSGKPVVCIQHSQLAFAARDFTGGEAARLWDQLLAQRAILVPDIEAALRQLESERNGNAD